MWVEHRMFLLLRGLLHSLSIGAAYRLAEVLVGCVVYLTKRQRYRGYAHLQIAFGDRSMAWRKRVYWAHVRHFAWVGVEWILLRAILEDPATTHALDIAELRLANERDALLSDHGALIVGSHQGNPDLTAASIVYHGWPETAVARDIGNPLVNAVIAADREALGRADVGKHGFMRSALRALKKDRRLFALLIDQDAGSQGVFVPYFGVPASTTPVVGYLALRTGAPVYVVLGIRRRPRKLEDHCHWVGPLAFDLTGDEEVDILHITEVCTAEVERFARMAPEQVMWGHRRWKTRPPEERRD